ncbi:MAG: prepilin-type N-terminal cleavage/methylation domain-containing protein [Nitrospirae bacterium]|nr:prepilin-type N-terminal cleavage/methylation domain-containing protein [Nitrospirota bacterium]
MRKLHKRLALGSEKGFTLIEMAIVLVIIGIILGAIMKGKDVMRSAQTKQLYQGFIGKWVSMADTYYDKTGSNLGDGASNGGGGTGSTVVDGLMDGIDASTTDTLRKAIRDVLIRAGINPCEIIKSGNIEDRAVCEVTGVNIGQGIVDSEVYGKVKNINAYLYYYLLKESATANHKRNLVVFRNVPIDIAQALDTMIDGIADGQAGRFLNLAVCATAADADTAGPGAPTNGADLTTALKPWNDGMAAGTNTYKCVVGYVLEH